MEITMDNLATTFRASGLTQEAFCKVHGITLERLRYYLYKKTKTKTERKMRNRRPGTVPEFISFNKTADISLKTILDSSQSLTIIHGKFTPKQLAAFISELGQLC
jgi:hypothetical protein